MAGKPGSGPGTFEDANFIYPDYANGASDEFDAGTTKTFSYNCHCSSEANCAGYMDLQKNDGSGFDTVKTTVCEVRKNTNCGDQYTDFLDQAGTFEYQVSCKIAAGEEIFIR
jgi:hypothetical protein